jgi:hypothetical protein
LRAGSEHLCAVDIFIVIQGACLIFSLSKAVVRGVLFNAKLALARNL